MVTPSFIAPDSASAKIIQDEIIEDMDVIKGEIEDLGKE